MISNRKYDFLMTFAKVLTDTERADVKEFEESRKMKGTAHGIKYFNSLNHNTEKKDFNVNYDKLLKAFKKGFKSLEGKDFDESRLHNVECILKYFATEDDFLRSGKHCRNAAGEFISQPSFDKGLLIIGDYGCGKSSTMKVIKELMQNTPLTFKSYTTNRIVTSFESFHDGSDRTAYINRTMTKDAYFDDVKTEKDASNYGLHNLMKGILEERSISNEIKTYMTCNYLETDSDKTVSEALYEFNTRYGARVFDRLFQMCNIIEFNGNSMRK